MKTVWNERYRHDLLTRVECLRSDSRPLWGKMSVAQMVVHITDQLRIATGDLSTKEKKTPFSLPVMKQLVVYVLPWPKGAPTAPELLAGVPGEWEIDRKRFIELLGDVARRDVSQPLLAHPAFGKLSRRAWGVLIYRHIDHHLRQFGT